MKSLYIKSFKPATNLRPLQYFYQFMVCGIPVLSDAVSLIITLTSAPKVTTGRITAPLIGGTYANESNMQ